MRVVLRMALFAVVLAGMSTSLGSAAVTPQGSVVERSVWSSALKRNVRTLVYLPPEFDPNGPPLPTLYLLHGTPGTPDSFFALGVGTHLDSLIDTGAAPSMIVVVPTGGVRPDSDTEWDDAVDDANARWGTFVTRDLVRAIDADYPTLRGRGSRAIAGISMGGYGAINLALGHTGTFGIASSWSGYFVSNTPKVDGPHRLGDLAGSLAAPDRCAARARAAAPAGRDLVLLGSRRPLLRRERLVQPGAHEARHPAPLPRRLRRARLGRLARPDGHRADVDRQAVQARTGLRAAKA